MWIAAVAVSVITVLASFSNTYNTQPIIGLCITFLLLCIIGLAYKSTPIQHMRGLILISSFIYFGFMMGGCPCLLFYFQGAILFLIGKTTFLLSFAFIITLLVFSVIFGAIWCGWLCWLGAFQEFIFKLNRWELLKSKKAREVLVYIQTCAFVVFVAWIIYAQRPVLCGYDPFISIVRIQIYNWIGYITVPLLIISSLFIYRPFCRILCPIGWLLYVVKYLPFAAKLNIAECTDCGRCHSYCKLHAIQNKQVEKTCIMCGECKNSNCSAITI